LRSLAFRTVPSRGSRTLPLPSPHH
jgi:hypothetical protein